METVCLKGYSVVDIPCVKICQALFHAAHREGACFNQQHLRAVLRSDGWIRFPAAVGQGQGEQAAQGEASFEKSVFTAHSSYRDANCARAMV